MRPAQFVCVALTLTGALLIAGCHADKGAAGTIGPGGVIGSSRAEARARRAQLTLDNGMAVVLAESHAAPVVAIQAWVGTGAADEPPELAGAAHLIEHVLRSGGFGPEGKPRRAPGQLAREVAAAGGLLDVWTSFDETVVEVTVASPFLDAGLTAVADMLTDPTLAAADIERGRKAVVEEQKQVEDDPARAASAALFAAAFGSHPYGRPLMGGEPAAGALGRDALAGFFRRAYGARNVTLVVAGDFDARAARAAIERAFAAVPRGDAGGGGGARPPIPAAGEPRVSVVARDGREPHLALGFRIPQLGHADLAALDLLAVVLGRREGGRLEQELVRNRQLAGMARAYTWSARQAGLFVVDVTPLGASRFEEAARTALDETLRLGREAISAAELERARVALERDLGRGSDGVDGYARRLGRYAALAGDMDGEARHLDRVRSLSADDLREAARKYLRASTLTTVALLPGGGDRLAAHLREIAGAAEARADQRARPPQIAASADPGGRAPAAAEEPARFVLPSGARVLVLRDGSTPMVSIEALWPGGLRDEDARSNGASTLVAELLARGTKTRSADQIDAEVGAMAGAVGGFSGRNGLGLRADVLAQHWEHGLELVTDCLRNPSFPDDELERARRATLDRIRAEDDDPGQAAFSLFAGAVWRRHPYRFDPLGAADAVSGLSRRRLLDHYRRHYGVAGLTVAVVGDVEPAAVAAKLQTLLGGAPGTPALVASPAARVPTAAPAPAGAAAAEPGDGPVELFRPAGKEQAYVVLGYPGVTLVDPDRFALAVLAQILGGADGRLPAELRERRALAYRIGATSIEGLDPGAFAVHAACAPRNLDAVVQALRAELARVVVAGVTADELARAARALTGAQAVGLRWRRSLASALAAGEAFGQGYLAYRRYPQDLARVSAADVQRVARRVFDDKRQVVAALRPAPEASAVEAQHGRAAGGGASAR